MKRLTNSKKNPSPVLSLSISPYGVNDEKTGRGFLFPQEKGLVKLIIIPVDARHAAQKIERTLVNPSSWSAG
jgi:hypothetical protein